MDESGSCGAEEPELLGATDVRTLAERLGLRPTKTLGQNFVVDPGTVRRILRVADLGPDDVVVEVGSGLGSLTLALLPAAHRVVAVEVDPVLAGALPVTIAERAPGHAHRLEVVTADACRVTSLPGPEPTVLVANLPYNVAVPVLLHLVETLPSLRRGLVMVQREIADRLVAAPGSRTYGVPSAKFAYYATARWAGQVSRNAFWPLPNVDSGLVAFTRRPPPPGSAGGVRGAGSAGGAGGTGGVGREEVFTAIDAAFGQRRKTLRAALAGWADSPARAEQALRAAGIDPSARGESLGIADFVRLAEQRPVA